MISRIFTALLALACVFAAGFGTCWWLHRPVAPAEEAIVSPPTPDAVAPSGEPAPTAQDEPEDARPVAAVRLRIRRSTSPTAAADSVPPNPPGGHSAPAAAVASCPAPPAPGDLSGEAYSRIVWKDGQPWARAFWKACVWEGEGRQVCRGPISGGDQTWADIGFAWTPPPAAPVRQRSLIGISAGATSAPAAELAVYALPERWAFRSPGAEGRVGLYVDGRLEQGGRREVGAGVIALFGVGRR